MHKKFQVSETLTVETGNSGAVTIDRADGGLVQVQPSEVAMLAVALVLAQHQGDALTARVCSLIGEHANGGAGADADQAMAEADKLARVGAAFFGSNGGDGGG